MEKVHTYKRHTVTLQAEQKDVWWIGKYSVRPMDPQDPHSHGDRTPGNYATEEEADRAALKAAKRWIDQDRPS